MEIEHKRNNSPYMYMYVFMAIKRIYITVLKWQMVYAFVIRAMPQTGLRSFLETHLIIVRCLGS